MDQGAGISEGVRFSVLGGECPVDDDELYRLYAYPPALSRCVVRANAIASLDGGATTGGSGHMVNTGTFSALAGQSR